MTRVWRHRLFLASPLIAIGVLALVSPSEDGPTICPFALCTGMACPGCGMTRAAAGLLRGDLDTALAYHPLVPLAALLGVAAWGWFILRITERVAPLSQRVLNVILIGSAAALLAVWAFRLAMGSLPPV